MRQLYGFHEADLIATAKEAGVAIMQHLSSPETLEKQSKNDDSPVTKADLAADAIIRRHLASSGIPVMSEEMPLEEQQHVMKQGTYWCVDPLDGTRTALHYAEGKSEATGFGVLIGLVRDGKPVFGVAHYPAQGPVTNGKPQGVTYFTNRTGNASFVQVGGKTPRRIHAQASMHGPLTIAAGYRGLAPSALGGRTAENRPDVGGSRILRAAEGKVDVGYMGNDGAVSFGFWDLAAPHAIIRGAGGELVTTPGHLHDHAQAGAFARSEPLRYDGVHFAVQAGEGKPYLPGCMAAHGDTLRSLGVPGMHAARHR